MHDRRGSVNLVLPLSPALRTRQRVSGAEAPGAMLTPRTPDCASPRPLVLSHSTAGNRKSSDSWNSLESADYEPDTEWKTDHLNFLIRTVEGLRASNLTPYNGVPPANLLDKVSLNIVNAKESWPHTARQTRLKLLELCRSSWREKLQSERRRSSIIREETGSDAENDPNGGTPARRRPLHRQSSMDFMNSSAKLGNKASEGFGKLSRLQHGPTTPKTERRSSNLNPRTPSSTTLNSSVSGSTGPRLNKRSSTLTVSSTDSYNGPCLLDPRVQRIRRSDSFGSLRVLEPQAAQGTPATPATRRTLKRAPSYGSSHSAGSTRFSMHMDTEEDCLEPVRSSNRDKSKQHRPRKDSTSSQTSDEEEKHRSKKSKKARRRSPSPPPPPSSLPCSPDVPIPFPSPAPAPVASSSRRRPRICPQRNPSMFGPELTGLGGLAGATSPRASRCPTSFPAQLSAAAVVNAATEAEAREREAEEAARELLRPRTMMASPGTPPDLTSPSGRRLRRVKAKDLLAARPSALRPAELARRISFGNLRQPEAHPVTVGAVETVPSALGGAFELI